MKEGMRTSVEAILLVRFSYFLHFVQFFFPNYHHDLEFDLFILVIWLVIVDW